MDKHTKLNHRLYCLTGEEFSLGRGNIEVVKQMLEAGVKLLQYREKEKGKLEKYNECLHIRKLTKEAGTTFIVNDDADIAIAVGADGLHLGQSDLPLKAARSIVGDKMIIGISTHCIEQAIIAVKDGADYLGVGPIYFTKTKTDVCAPVGLEYLDYISQNVKIPFVAIGGIKLCNLSEVIDHGASCAALVTEIVGSEDIAATIRNINKKFISYQGE